MASSVIGALRVNLGIDTAAFTTGLKMAEGKLGGFSKVGRNALVALTAAATTAAVGMATVVKGTINAADEMSKAAQKFGLPIEELSRLKYAADLSDVSLESLGVSVGRLSKNMALAATGSKGAVKAFSQLGIEFRNSDGTLKSSSVVLEQIADRFVALPDGAAKTALAIQLLGKSGADMIPLLNGGSKALREMKAEADSFGQVFTEDMGRQAEEFNDNLTRVRGAFANVAAEVTRNVLPMLVQFSQWMVTNAPKIAEKATGIAKAFAGVAVDIADTITWVQRLTDSFGNSKTASFSWATFLGSQFARVRTSAEVELTKAQAAVNLFNEMKANAEASVRNLGGGTGQITVPPEEADKTSARNKANLDELRNKTRMLVLQSTLHGDAALRAAEATRTAAEFTARIGKTLKDDVVPPAEDFAFETTEAAGGAGKVADATEDLAENLKRIVKPTAQFTKSLKEQQALTASIAGGFASIGKAMMQIGTTDGIKDALGGVATSISATFLDPFVAKMEAAFEGIADKLATSMQKIGRGGIGKTLGLGDPNVTAGLGAGLGMAAAGALQGSTKAIGSGIGLAAGAAIGSFFGPVGTFIGASIGGAAGGMFGGTTQNWGRPTGTAFQGTTFASSVSGSRNVNLDAGASQAGKFAFQGTANLLADFNKELGEYVDNLGGTMEKGLKLVVNNDAALKRITGTISDRTVNRGGESEDDAAARISKRVSEIMGLAAALAQNAGPALTETQTLWRETQERFSKTNVLILKDLGFAAREIRNLQGDIKDDLREGFSKGLLDSIVDSGRASRKEVDAWRKYELDSLEERRKAAVRTAREIGASVDLVNSAFRAERRDISEEYRELLEDMAKSTAGLQEKMARLESKRAGILQELTRRSDEALRAEEALRDARRGLAGGGLNPGGPRDIFAALKGQFTQAINAAKGGDADAATRAAGLASALLESGRGVFASGTDYAALFKSVNEQLVKAQQSFDKRGDKLAKALDDKTFKDVQERSTKALLVGLQRLDERLEEVAHEIKRQTRETRRDGQRKSVG